MVGCNGWLRWLTAMFERLRHSVHRTSTPYRGTRRKSLTNASTIPQSHGLDISHSTQSKSWNQKEETQEVCPRGWRKPKKASELDRERETLHPRRDRAGRSAHWKVRSGQGKTDHHRSARDTSTTTSTVVFILPERLLSATRCLSLIHI